MKLRINCLLIAIALWLAFDTVSAQEVRRAVPVVPDDSKQEVRRAIPVVPDHGKQEQEVELPADYGKQAPAAEAREFLYVPNSSLAYNQVEASPEYPWDIGDYYTEKPVQRPVNVPTDYILVELWFDMPPLQKVGWLYMDAESVNWLHLGPTL
jgi:hypothetical protein